MEHSECYPEGCATTGVVPCQRNARELQSKLLKCSLPRKIVVTSKPPVGDISVVTLIRTDTTLDHSQKAEKVCRQDARRSAPRTRKVAHDVSYIASFSRAALDLGVHARGLAQSSVSAMHFYVHDKPKCWAEAPVKIARMTLTIKLDGNWSSFQLANNTPPLSVTGSVIAPSARIERTTMGRRLVEAGLGSPWLSRGLSAKPPACQESS